MEHAHKHFVFSCFSIIMRHDYATHCFQGYDEFVKTVDASEISVSSALYNLFI